MSMYVCLKPTKPLGFAGIKFLWKSIQNLTFNSIFFELWGGVLLDAQLGCKSVCMYVCLNSRTLCVCMYVRTLKHVCLYAMTKHLCMYVWNSHTCMYVRRNPRAWLCMYGWEYLQIRCIAYVCFKWRSIYVCMSQTYIHTNWELGSCCLKQLLGRPSSMYVCMLEALKRVCMYVWSPQACMYVCLKPSSAYVCMPQTYNT